MSTSIAHHDPDASVALHRTSPQPEGSAMGAASEQIGPQDLVRLFHRYRGMILAIVSVITVLVLAQQLASPPLYQSSSNVQVELIDEVGTNQADVNSRNAERVANTVRLHRSRSVAGQIIKDLDLLNDERFRRELGNDNLTGKALMQLAINHLLGMLAINAESGSDLIQISVTSRSPELAADIVDKGIVLTGGGALLGNMDEALRQATGLPVSLADDPLSCVVMGTGRALEEMKRLKDVLSSMY